MDKADIMTLGSILKFGLGFVGIVTTLVLLTAGLVKKDNKKIKKAGLIFLGTWVILILLGTLEFLVLQ
ncbi:MAG: hypothetical protein AB7K37_16890 [Cyclobacteriaceae bacterium]